MEAQAHFLVEFINNKSMFFSIPLYQRKYKWTKKIVDELIDDLEQFQKNEKISSYFLGSIVVKKNSNLNSKYILVDGQQRITTLFLIFSALCDLLKSKELNSSSFYYQIAPLLKTNKKSNNGDKFKLNGMKGQNIMLEIIRGNANYLSKKDKNSQYFKVYEIFKKEFTKKINNSINELEEFYEEAIKKIKVAIINLEPNEDELLIFQSINSKGQHLSSADLIKSYIMNNLNSADEKDMEIKELFQKEFIDKLSDQESSNLFRQILAIETGKLFSMNSKKLYYEFKNFYKKNEQKINKTFIESLIYDLKVYKDIMNVKDIMNFKEKEDVKIDIHINKSLPLLKTQLMNFYSIIHLVIRKNSNFKDQELIFTKEEKNNIRYVIDYLSKLVVARTLCSFGRVESNKEYAKLSFELKNELNKNNFKDAVDKVIIEHLDNTDNKYRMPSQDEIKSKIMKNDLYSDHKSMLKWILIALDQDVIKPEILSKPEKISIEHIYPQNPSSGWKKQLSEDERQNMDAIRNTLGNLSITYHNSYLSNKTADQKKKILAEKTYLKINKLFYEEKVWNYEAIKKRSEKLLKKIFNFWWN